MPSTAEAERHRDVHVAILREDKPPRWKMAVITWLGVNPAVYIFSRAVPGVLRELPTWTVFLIVNGFVVASLAWVFMPLLTKLFHRWLQPGPA